MYFNLLSGPCVLHVIPKQSACIQYSHLACEHPIQIALFSSSFSPHIRHRFVSSVCPPKNDSVVCVDVVVVDGDVGGENGELLLLDGMSKVSSCNKTV